MKPAGGAGRRGHAWCDVGRALGVDGCWHDADPGATRTSGESPRGTFSHPPGESSRTRKPQPSGSPGPICLTHSPRSRRKATILRDWTAGEGAGDARRGFAPFSGEALTQAPQWCFGTAKSQSEWSRGVPVFARQWRLSRLALTLRQWPELPCLDPSGLCNASPEENQPSITADPPMQGDLSPALSGPSPSRMRMLC